jgi:hypothetical protein
MSIEGMEASVAVEGPTTCEVFEAYKRSFLQHSRHCHPDSLAIHREFIDDSSLSAKVTTLHNNGGD